MSSLVRIELTLDEADLVGAAVCRDRDRILDDALGHAGTRLITDREETHVPLHQAILRKIEHACSEDNHLTTLIHAVVGHGQPSSGDGQLDKVRTLCDTFSIGALRIAIDVHRSNCRQEGCPVLAVMVAAAEARS